MSAIIFPEFSIIIAIVILTAGALREMELLGVGRTGGIRRKTKCFHLKAD